MPKPVLTVFRNAIAHLPDFATGNVPANISFDEGILRCWSQVRPGAKSHEVVFRDEQGFVEFIRDLLRLIKKSALALIKRS